MTRSKSRDRQCRATVGTMSRKKKTTPPEQDIPAVDEAEFTEVIRRMVNTEPIERKTVEQIGRAQRLKNPAKRRKDWPLFMPASPEVRADVERQMKWREEHKEELEALAKSRHSDLRPKR